MFLGHKVFKLVIDREKSSTRSKSTLPNVHHEFLTDLRLNGRLQHPQVCQGSFLGGRLDVIVDTGGIAKLSWEVVSSF